MDKQAPPSRGAAQDSFLRRVVTVVGVTALALLLLALFVRGIDILLAAFGGVLLAVLLHACADFLQRRTPLSYRWSLGVVTLLLLLVFGVAAWLLAPRLAEQFDQLREQWPVLLSRLRGYLQQYGWGQQLLGQLPDEAGAVVQEVAANAQGGLAALMQWSTYLLVVLSVGFFAAADPRLYRNALVHLAPLRHRDRMREMLGEMGATLRWWLIGQLLTMLIVGVSTALVLWAFGMPLAIVLGLIVGLLGFIPYLGQLAGALPVAMVAATQGVSQLLYVMLAYAAVQMLEGYVATPIIQHRTVYLPPAITITTQLVLGSVLGVLGVILAVPLAAVALVLVRFYRTDLLDDPEAAQDKDRRGPGAQQA